MTFPTGLILDVNPTLLGLSDGASVPQLTDSSGGHIHGTQAVTANRGTYRANVQNGKAAVEFDGINDSYSFGNLFNLMSAGEVFLVYGVADDPAVTPYVSGLWTTGAGGGFSSTHFPFNDGSIYDGWGSTTRFSVGNPTPSLTSPRLYNVSSATGDWKARLDTALLFSSASSTVAFPNPFLFGRSNDASYNAKGRLFRLLIFNRVLEEFERQAVQFALAAEYLLAYYQPLLLPQTGLEIYCEANRMTLSDGGQVSGLTDFSGNNRHLTASLNYPTFETNEINSKPVIRFHGTSNPLKNSAQFTIRCGWILAKYSGSATFPDYKGLLSDLNVTTILLGEYGTANFLDNQSTQIFEFRSNDRIYPESDAPAPMLEYKLIFFRFWRNLFLDGVQLGQQTNFSSTKWHGDVPFLALYSRDSCESDIRR